MGLAGALECSCFVRWHYELPLVIVVGVAAVVPSVF